MEEKKQTIRLTAKEKKQERRHEKAAKPEKWPRQKSLKKRTAAWPP